MKKTRKMLAMLLSMMLVAVVAIGGTYAYLTSQTAVVTNTFTVGNVNIDLKESLVDEYGEKYLNGKEVVGTAAAAEKVTANEYKMIPGHTYIKDPTITVDADSEDCWVFAKVEINVTEDADGLTIAKQLEKLGWTAVETGVYGYEKKLSAGQSAVVFEKFTLAGTSADGEEAVAAMNIKITGYAVQADGFDTAAAAWKAAPATWA